MKNYALDTKMLPKVWVTWASTKDKMFNKRYWLNCQTGKKKTKPESWMYYENEGSFKGYGKPEDGRTRIGCHWYTNESDKIWVKNGSVVRYAYAKYHADIDRLEVAAVGIDTTRAEEPHAWKFLGDRFYIAKDKTIVTQNGVLISNWFNLYQYHTARSGSQLLGMLIGLNTSPTFLTEFKKFIGSDFYTIGNGATEAIQYAYQIQRWYKTTQKTRNAGKQQALTDELVEMPLSDASDFAEKYPVKKSSQDRWGRELRDIVYYERINDNLSVLRSFARSWGGNQLQESWRMYLSDDGMNRIVAKTNDGWIPSRQIKDGWHRYSYIANPNEAMSKCNRIKYILGAVKDLPDEKATDFLVTALRFPEIEQLIKLGHQDVGLRITSSHTPKADLKKLFGGYYNDKEKNVLRKIGLTKEQLDCVMSSDEYYYRESGLVLMREIFGNDLSYIDKDLFAKYFNGCVKSRRFMWRGLSHYANEFNLDTAKLLKNMIRLAEKRENIWTIVNDTMNSYSYLRGETRPEIDWYFDDVSDAVRVHDAIIELKRIQDAERRAMWDMNEAERRKKEEEKRVKVDKARKIYEYEDDNYIIRLPKDSAEIIKEGNMQHICIGGYTSRHALGDTNIFFLRQKSEDEVPFYAIEMNNNKTIVQIHGFGNKWLGNNPEAIPTVIRWIRKHGISCRDNILTCTAKGYGGNAQCIAMPIVD